MGCGAVCGATSDTLETIRPAEKSFKQLFTRITPNQFLFHMQKFASFAKELQLNPRKFQLVITNKLQPKSTIPEPVMEKWKIILYGLDSNNINYVNCLGYPQKNVNPNKSFKPSPQASIKNSQQQMQKSEQSQTQIFHHKCFTQIEKDLDRTYRILQMSDQQKKVFSQILRRIANHFPSMGYTHGIDLIVGYLLVIGYQEEDAFWIFNHIALNRRYMLLGLFEDRFPLSSVYILIFRNLLKRCNKRLHNHLYETVFVDESIWVFKWFITYYLYSFPIQMCQYIWDIVISIGGIGLVTFAVSLVNKLQDQLLAVDDPCQISQLFEQLKEINSFNRLVNIREIVNNSYEIKLISDDLDGLKGLKNSHDGKPNIYAQYLFISFTSQIEKQASNMTNFEQYSATDPILFKKISIDKGEELLDEWYLRLFQQRQKFRQESKIKLAAATPTSINVHNPNLQLKKSKQIKREEDIKMNEVHNLDDQLNSYLESFTHKRPSSRKSDTKKTEFDKKKQPWEDEELEQQEERDIMNIQDQFHYVASKGLSFKRRIGFGKINQVSSYSQKRTIKTDHSDGMKFVPIAHKVLNGTGMSNASKSSVSSQNNTYKQNRSCSCKKKLRSQEKQDVQRPIKPKKYDTPQNIDSLEQMLNQSTQRKRVNTYHNWIANSHVPEIKNNSLAKQTSEISSQVQIYNGPKMFRKKTKGRIGGAVSTKQQQTHFVQRCERCNLESPDLQKIGFQQQSYDSIMIGNNSSQRSSVVSYQIESVK